jgi:eukaryotic-like serine/threonine-protein kinase
VRHDAVTPLWILGRYAVYEAIAAGGMASVHLGRQLGDAGFARTVAIKRLLPEAAQNPDVVAMFTDEARLAARVSHPNVVRILDVVSGDAELFLVMEYIVGDSLAALMRGMRRLGVHAPPDVASGVLLGVLYGLHTAHEAVAEDGTPLNIVHRDVSPHNVLVGVDGIARVVDFGIAKAAVQLHTTRDNEIRGKLAYMAPEQIRADQVTRFADIYAAGVVLWELLAGQRLFSASSEGALLWRVLEGEVTPLLEVAPHVGAAVAAVAERALERDPARRFGSALEMARTLERALPPASPSVVGAWVSRVAGETLATRAALVARIERATSQPLTAPPSQPGSRSSVTSVAPALPASSARSALPAPVELRNAHALRPAEHGTHTLTALAVNPPTRRAAGLTLAVLALTAVTAVGAGRWAVGGATRAPATPAASGAAPSQAASGAAPSQAASGAAPSPAASGAAPSPAQADAAGEGITGAEAQMQPGAPPTSGTLAGGLEAASSRASAPAQLPPSTTPARSARSPCDPPYFVDANGIRRVKRQCLR